MGEIAGGGERSLMEGRGFRWRRAVSGGGEDSLVEGSGVRWRGAVSGGGEQCQVEGSTRCLVKEEQLKSMRRTCSCLKNNP